MELDESQPRVQVIRVQLQRDRSGFGFTVEGACPVSICRVEPGLRFSPHSRPLQLSYPDHAQRFPFQVLVPPMVASYPMTRFSASMDKM